MNGSIRKRGQKSWELSIDLGRDPNGKRLRKFVNVKGTKGEAQKKLRDLLVASDKGIPIDAKKVAVAQWLQKWLEEYVIPKRRQQTMERYEGIIRNHLVPALGHIELTKLAPNDIQALEAKLTTSGMAPMGVREVHHVISGALKYALKMDAVWRNPAQAVTPPKAERKEVVPPDMAGVKQILAMAQANEHRFFSCLHFIAYTGVRRGEALGLRWRDVNLETGAASIAQTVVVSHQQGLIFQPPKTNSGRRVIDLDDDTVAVLRALQGQQLLHKVALEGAYQDRNLVFANPLGNPIYPDTLARNFRNLAGAVGLEGLKLHDLRHFHASVLIQRGESPALVSKRLGHATVSITMDVYAHLLKGYQKDAANGFAKAMREA